MIVRFDVPKINLAFACRIRDLAQKLGVTNWSIITVDPESVDPEDGEEGFDHFVMIRDLETNVAHDLCVNSKEEMSSQIDISTEVA